MARCMKSDFAVRPRFFDFDQGEVEARLAVIKPDGFLSMLFPMHAPMGI